MELRDLYDEFRNKTGEYIRKDDEIPNGRYFITVAIIMKNSEGKFLIQKASKIKDNKWATTGGHPKKGETSLEGIISEVNEEIGVDISSYDIKLIETIKTHNGFFDLYYIEIDCNLDELVLQEDEVEEVMYSSLEEIDSMYEQGTFRKTHYKMFQSYKNWLNK